METVDTQLGGMLSLDFVKNGNDVSIENIVWTPLVNHFGDGTFRVIPLKDYTDDLNASHFVLAKGKPNAISYFKQKTEEIIPSEFEVEM
jgi:poly-gamma-glutamate synthesis protein (capsule biosynthesis protein)